MIRLPFKNKLLLHVGPLGKVDPDVEDLLLEVADDFIDSVRFFLVLCKSCFAGPQHENISVLAAKLRARSLEPSSPMFTVIFYLLELFCGFR
jgi:hypothetical protein